MSEFFLYCSPLIPLMLTEPESQGIKWAVGPVSEAPGAEKALLFSITIIDTCSHA